MNSEMGVFLWSMSSGDSMEKGKGYDDTIGYCNDLKLELRLHLGKDLRKCKGWIRSGKA